MELGRADLASERRGRPPCCPCSTRARASVGDGERGSTVAGGAHACAKWMSRGCRRAAVARRSFRPSAFDPCWAAPRIHIQDRDSCPVRIGSSADAIFPGSSENPSKINFHGFHTPTIPATANRPSSAVTSFFSITALGDRWGAAAQANRHPRTSLPSAIRPRPYPHSRVPSPTRPHASSKLQEAHMCSPIFLANTKSYQEEPRCGESSLRTAFSMSSRCRHTWREQNFDLSYRYRLRPTAR